MSALQVKPIYRASWQTPTQGMIYLSDDWRKLDMLPPIFFSPAGTELLNLRRACYSWFGATSGYWVEDGQLVFAVDPARDPLLDLSRDPLYVAGDFNHWRGGGNSHWKLQPTRYRDQDWLLLKMPKAFWKDKQPHQFKFVTNSGRWLDVWPDAPNRMVNKDGTVNFQLQKNLTGLHIFVFDAGDVVTHPGEIAIRWDDGKVVQEIALDPGPWLYSLLYEGRLGAWVSQEHTHFAVFAPQADKVEIAFYPDAKMSTEQRLDLARRADGVWSGAIDENLTGQYYHLIVHGPTNRELTHFDDQVRILDPYARACVKRDGPALIVEDQRFLMDESKRFTPPHWHDLIIVEAHIRDLLALAEVDLKEDERLGFKGLTRWLQRSDCYLRELGVNAVELLPVQEFDNGKKEDYHWGYMPVNFFSPASAYATDPASGSQIEEFRECVQAFHDAGIAVILDVVYNHVGEPNPLLYIDKYYYFELEEDGSLCNWSGCGNDLSTRGPMAVRMIIDSLLHLIRAYDVDGFRFDLAELLGIEALLQIEQALKREKPSIILIAEPWSFRGHIASKLKHTGWASWNDGYRKFIHGYVKGEESPDGLRYYLTGSRGDFTHWPAQTVNYSESHDDFCWIDSITEHPDHNAIWPTALDRRRTHLMFAVLFVSAGIPMFAAGQDFMRTKQGVNNTYQRGDLNVVDYQRQRQYSASNEYVRQWVLLRRSRKGRLLCHDSNPSDGYYRFFSGTDSLALGVWINADGSKGRSSLFFAVNPTFSTWECPVAELQELRWTQLADTERMDPFGLSSAFSVPRQGCLRIPPYSCGLWLLEPGPEPLIRYR